jgi:hypothetical protein
MLIANGLLMAAAFGLVFGGAASALAGANLVKRVSGVLAAFVGSMIGLSALGAEASAVVAAVAVAFAYCAVGASILVRLQESHGAIETSAIDGNDQADEPVEPRS